jgi:hypothetical protein
VTHAKKQGRPETSGVVTQFPRIERAELARKKISQLRAAMAANTEGTKIVLQVGSELRIRNNGDVIVDNPAIELASGDGAGDAVILYRFNEKAGEQVFRLLASVADHQHLKTHRQNDWPELKYANTCWARAKAAPRQRPFFGRKIVVAAPALFPYFSTSSTG